jgi:hypothetical protein
MWQVNITCSGEAWKHAGAAFSNLVDTYQAELIGSKKMPDDTRIMSYKLEGISDLEAFQEDCSKFAGFTTDFESL